MGHGCICCGWVRITAVEMCVTTAYSYMFAYVSNVVNSVRFCGMRFSEEQILIYLLCHPADEPKTTHRQRIWFHSNSNNTLGMRGRSCRKCVLCLENADHPV